MDNTGYNQCCVLERSKRLGFPTLIFYLYLLIVPIGLVLLGLWLMRYMGRLPYAPEKRLLFIAIIIACLTFIAFSMGVKLNNWRSPEPSTNPAQNIPQQSITPQTTGNGAKNTVNPPGNTELRVPDEPVSGTSTLAIGTDPAQNAPSKPLNQEERLELFESENYPALYEQRMGLIGEINAQQTFLKRLEQLANHTPKQRKLLADIYTIRQAAYRKLQQRNVSVSQHLRDFWVHYNTGNSHDATNKFTPVATKLAKKIQETLGQLLDSRRQEEQVIAKHLRKAGLALKNNKLPAHQAGKITTYTQQNRALVIDWLTKNEHAHTLDILERLHQQRIIIRDRYHQVKAFQQRYPDLKTRLNRTLKLWGKAQESNYYAEYRLLYAAESRFIIDYMDIGSGKAADKRLDRELSAYTDVIANHAEVALEKAEQAYKPGKLR